MQTRRLSQSKKTDLIKIEIQKLLKLAWPIILAQLLYCMNAVVDTIMSGHHSPVTLSQVAMGASLWTPLMIFLTGLYSGLSALSAYAFGKGQEDVLKKLLSSGIVIGIFLSIFLVYVLNHASVIFPLFSVPDQLGQGITDYLDMVALGFPCVVIFIVLRSWVEGLHKTSLPMFAALIGVIANIPLNYVFIYGFWFIPELGPKGCGIATALSSLIMALALFIIVLRNQSVGSMQIQWLSVFNQFSLHEIRNILKIGGPLGLAGFVEGSFFCFIAIMLAPLGATSVAAHQIALNISSMFFMVPLGLNFALTVAVGKAYGEHQTAEHIRNIIISGFCVALVFACCSSSILYFGRFFIPNLYTGEVEVGLLASELLILAAIFQLCDGAQVMLYAALKGLQDTLIPMFLTITAFWIFGASLGYSFTFFEAFGALGAKGAWIGLNIGLTLAFFAFAYRLSRVFKARFGVSFFNKIQEKANTF